MVNLDASRNSSGSDRARLSSGSTQTSGGLRSLNSSGYSANSAPTKTSSSYQRGNTSESGWGSKTVNTDQTQYTSGNKLTSSYQQRRGNTVVDTMDPETRAAYNRLLKELESGGSAAQKAATAGAMAELLTAQNKREEYSINAAKEQAQRSVALATQTFNEQIMPQLMAAMEGAGLSGDSMNALLSQDAASRAARQAADAEAGLIKSYGELAQGQQGVALAASQQLAADPVQAALLKALEVGKGSLTTTNVLETITGSENVNWNETVRTTGTQTTNELYGKQGSSSVAQYGTENDALGLFNAETNRLNAQTAADSAASQSRLNDINALKGLESIMPGSASLIGGYALEDDPLHGAGGDIFGNAGGGRTIARSGMFNNILGELSFNF